MKKHIKQWLQAWHDGELDYTLTPTVEAHLATCGACQEELNDLEGLASVLHADDDLLSEALAFIPEDAFVKSVMERIHEEDIVQQSVFDSWIWKRIPVALISTWMLIQVGWAAIQGLRTLDWVTTEVPWLNNIIQAFDSGKFIKMGAHTTLGSEVLDRLNIRYLVDATLNPATLSTFIVGAIFFSWFCIWWLHQEKRIANKNMTHNGGY